MLVEIPSELQSGTADGRNDINKDEAHRRFTRRWASLTNQSMGDAGLEPATPACRAGALAN